MPAGNTAIIKVYKGGDLAPDSENYGLSAYYTSPVRNVMGAEPDSGYTFGMREILQETDMVTFDGARAGIFDAPYPALLAGTDIGYGAEPPDSGNPPFGEYDFGLMVQFNIGNQTTGAAAGSYHKPHISYAGLLGINLDAQWASETFADTGRLDVSLMNTYYSSKTGLGFAVDIPSPLVVGAITNTCGGSYTLWAIPSHSLVSLSPAWTYARSRSRSQVPLHAATR